MTCTVSERIAGPCKACGERAEPGHIVTDQRGPAIPAVNLYCAKCCPKCAAKEFVEALEGMTK